MREWREDESGTRLQRYVYKTRRNETREKTLKRCTSTKKKKQVCVVSKGYESPRGRINHWFSIKIKLRLRYIIIVIIIKIVATTRAAGPCRARIVFDDEIIITTRKKKRKKQYIIYTHDEHDDHAIMV